MLALLSFLYQVQNKVTDFFNTPKENQKQNTHFRETRKEKKSNFRSNSDIQRKNSTLKLTFFTCMRNVRRKDQRF